MGLQNIFLNENDYHLDPYKSSTYKNAPWVARVATLF
jgi:hypothetical protein